VQGADQGDTSTLLTTLTDAVDHLEHVTDEDGAGC
jgi:hypothetical protein